MRRLVCVACRAHFRSDRLSPCPDCGAAVCPDCGSHQVYSVEDRARDVPASAAPSIRASVWGRPN